jgi:hypothetical protein
MTNTSFILSRKIVKHVVSLQDLIVRRQVFESSAVTNMSSMSYLHSTGCTVLKSALHISTKYFMCSISEIMFYTFGKHFLAHPYIWKSKCLWSTLRRCEPAPAVWFCHYFDETSVTISGRVPKAMTASFWNLFLSSFICSYHLTWCTLLCWKLLKMNGTMEEKGYKACSTLGKVRNAHMKGMVDRLENIIIFGKVTLNVCVSKVVRQVE